MLFPTLDFGLFFLFVFSLTWLLRRHLDTRKAFLLAASYFFYGYWDWRFLGLLALGSSINYVAGLALSQTDTSHQRKWIVGIAVTLGLLILGGFKYYGFFIEQLGDILLSIGWERDLLLLDIILPIGISFFTFQGISYVVDVYRGDVAPVRNPVDVFLYISFFPQLVAGPIVRAAHFLPQLAKPPRLEPRAVALGFVLILSGMVKKMIVASYLATEIVDEVFSFPQDYSSLDLYVGAHAFVVQIYCDFSGYSDIAIGVAALLGYRFKKNFDRPLAATSYRALWQRWHISMTSWFRDYFYRPLRGERGSARRAANRSQVRMYRNLFLTMLVAGLWHGAAWTFVIWGGLQGLILVGERIVKAGSRQLSGFLAPSQNELSPVQVDSRGTLASGAVSRVGGWFVTINLFALAAILFRAPDLDTAGDYLDGLLAASYGIEMATPFVVLLISGSILAQCLTTDISARVARRLEARHPVVLGAVLGFGLLAIELAGPDGVAPFIYFQF